MDYYRNLKLQFEAAALSSAQMGALMVALMKPRGLREEPRASEVAPEAQRDVVGGENEEPLPCSPWTFPAAPAPGPRETPQCRVVGMRLVPEPASWKKEKHRVEHGPQPCFRVRIGPLGGLVSRAAGLAFVPVCWSLLLFRWGFR